MAAKNETKPAEQIISATENTEIFNIVIPVKLVLSSAPQSSISAPFEIGPRFEDSEKLTRRDLRFALSLKLALIGFVLFKPESGFIFIILC